MLLTTYEFESCNYLLQLETANKNCTFGIEHFFLRFETSIDYCA